MIPFWAKDPAIGFKTINGMSETAASKPAFREAMRTRRCLIPADAFYEWKKIGPKKKQPYNFGMADDSIFAFAGLWDRWKDAAGKQILSCTILTTNPNALVAAVHADGPRKSLVGSHLSVRSEVPFPRVHDSDVLENVNRRAAPGATNTERAPTTYLRKQAHG